MNKVDHKTFLQNLPAEKRAELLQKNDLSGAVHLTTHWGATLCLGMLICLQIPFWYLLLPLQGILIVFCFTLLHETLHDTPFESQWLNRFAGFVSGLLLFIPPLWFRYFHLAHHRYTNDPENDPELEDAKPSTKLAYTSGPIK